MSESEPDARVTWLEDPPETWQAAPDDPPRVDAGEEVTASRAGGLLLKKPGSYIRFLFTTNPERVRR